MKITIGFGVVLLCTVILSVAVIITGQMTNSQLTSIEELSDFQSDVNDFVNYFNDARIGTRELLNNHSIDQYNRAVTSYNQADSTLKDLTHHTTTSASLSEHGNTVEQLTNKTSEWMRIVNELQVSNQSLYDMRIQLDSMITQATNLANTNIYAAQLDKLESDIKDGKGISDMLWRHSRVTQGANLVSAIQMISTNFNPLIAYHDITGVTAAVAFGAEVQAALDAYIEDSPQQQDKDYGEAVKDIITPYFSLIESYIAEVNHNIQIKSNYESQISETVAIIDTTLGNVNKSVADTIVQAVELGNLLLMIAVVLAIIAVAAGLAIAIYLVRSISKPLTALSDFMKRAGTTGDITLTQRDSEVIGKYAEARDEIGQTIANSASFVNHIGSIAKELETIADGDLSHEVTTLSDTDQMGHSLKKMTNSLNNIFTDINLSTLQVSTGSKQVADGAQSLAQGATEQAASIEQLSHSISEIAERTKENAAIADKTSKLAVTIKENAEKGSHQMDEMITAVNDINEASKNISKIIKTIDDIAFQTNILALNAAVEAARAGQHGKGFAVVAEEVRNLASKSAEAAKDTGNMIQNSTEKAQLGSRIAGETATSLKEIVSGISESNQLIEEIANSSEQQSMGISEINTGIDQVAQVVQQNSATAEESAAASEEMSGQSDILQQLIVSFKLRGDDAMRHKVLQSGASQRKPALQEKNDYVYPGSAGNFGKY
jgi:methyl-accepting chemotaxis protein